MRIALASVLILLASCASKRQTTVNDQVLSTHDQLSGMIASAHDTLSLALVIHIDEVEISRDTKISRADGDTTKLSLNTGRVTLRNVNLTLGAEQKSHSEEVAAVATNETVAANHKVSDDRQIKSGFPGHAVGMIAITIAILSLIAWRMRRK